jgi:hypothetical protein
LISALLQNRRGADTWIVRNFDRTVGRGNRTRETTTQGSTDSDGKTFASNRLAHRLVSVATLDMCDGAQSVKYEYDAFGNRTKFTSASVGKGAERNQTGYFFYDATNRTLVSGALDALGAVGA